MQGERGREAARDIVVLARQLADREDLSPCCRRLLLKFIELIERVYKLRRRWPQ